MGSNVRDRELKQSEDHDLGPVNNFPQGIPIAVEVGRRKVMVVRDGDHVYALRDVCPHQGASISSGRVISTCLLRRRDSEWVETNLRAVQCPWHGWAFGLDDGEALFDSIERFRVRSYSARVAEGRVWMQMEK
jgi:nitrite reductase/ring-hydroxylating ferredoxin subunit